MERDFNEMIGEFYTIPEGAPKAREYEEFSYYRHPAGNYTGFVGKLNAKFKSLEGKNCSSDTPGAKFSHYTLPLWITSYHGTTEAPKTENLLEIKPDGIVIPNRALHECYFGVYIPNDPTRFWSLARLFADWQIPEHSKYNIVQQSKANPAMKVINFQGFPAYYGVACKFFITFKKDSEKQSRYIDGKVNITLDNRLPIELLKVFEKDVEEKINKERAERESLRKAQDTYIPDEPPAADFDEIFGSNTESDGLDEFIK